ncbi:uncharacterized protein LOC133734534 isoform X1 [Rosa rugosa]|uniref:uncharacterized protein LOC133734534 isoform X1 n=1 Tax=Rosa rugosa TaxID=74645 RepID=UPI002B40E020|nr:uncharacterized protein LOC133734534 isoform X1 [Rosa rugosa]
MQLCLSSYIPGGFLHACDQNPTCLSRRTYWNLAFILYQCRKHILILSHEVFASHLHLKGFRSEGWEVAASQEVLEASSGNGKSFRVHVMVLLTWPINSLLGESSMLAIS